MAGEYLTPPLLTQGAGSNIPQLSYQMENASWFPQAGTLPPVSCDPCIPVENNAGQNLFWLAVVAGGLVLLTVRKRKPKGEGQTTYGF